MTALGFFGLWVGGSAALFGLFMVWLEAARWRARRREDRGARRLLELGERARRQERAAVAAVVRPHGRRVVALSCEKRPVVTRRRMSGGG